MFRDSRRVRQLLLLMILTSITLITIDYRGGANSPFRGLRRSAGTFFGPIERGVSSALRPVGDLLSTLGNVRNVDRELKALKAERAAVEGQKRTNEDKDRQYEEMRRLLKLLDKGQYVSIPTHVIAAAPTNFTWTVTIDAGSNRGVRKDQTVLNSSGLVGRVIEVSKFTSTVLLAIDVKSTVGARLSYTGETGRVKGNGPGEMLFEVTPATAEVRRSQPIVTAGSTFVQGVPIGEVVTTRAAPGATSRSVTVRPYVDFEKLDLVAVVVKPARKSDPDVLVPANPSPTPTEPPLPRCTSAAPAPPTEQGAATGEGESLAPEASTSSTPAAPAGPQIPCLGSMPSPAAPAADAAPSP